MERLGAAQHRGQRLERHARDVVERLLRGQGDAGGLGVRPEPHGPGIGGAEALLHDRWPRCGGPRGASRSPRRSPSGCRRRTRAGGAKRSTGSPALDARLDVRDAVGQREGQLLDRRRAGLPDVVAGDRHRVELRDRVHAELDHVDDDPDGGRRRADPLLLGAELLQHVVLDRPVHLGPGHASAAPPPPGTSPGSTEAVQLMVIDVRDPAEGDAVEEPLHVGERRDRHALAADLAARLRVVGVVPHQGRHVEGGRQTRSGPARAGT